jgi:hypothetical protein
MTIPTSDKPPLVRTDFSNDAAWQTIRAAILTIPPEMQDAIGIMHFINDEDDDEDDDYLDEPWFVDIIDDRRFADWSTQDVIKNLPGDHNHACLFIVDRETIESPDGPILVVDLRSGGSHTFRTIPSEVVSLGSNLPISNLDWEDFANRVDEHGVFRGF